MFKLQPSDKDLLLTILRIAVTLGVMVILIQLLGEVHGLMCTVVVLIGQIAFLGKQVCALERALRISRETNDAEHSNSAEKII